MAIDTYIIAAIVAFFIAAQIYLKKHRGKNWQREYLNNKKEYIEKNYPKGPKK
ncbi:MAG: hypothetical protein AABX00_03325 [Nanoarchaeota archaeon]